MSNERTPMQPWAAKKIGDTSSGDGVYAITRSGLTVAEPLLKASALEIVHACNAHEQLVAALDQASLDVDQFGGDRIAGEPLVRIRTSTYNALVKAAKGEA